MGLLGHVVVGEQPRACSGPGRGRRAGQPLAGRLSHPAEVPELLLRARWHSGAFISLERSTTEWLLPQ